MIPRQTRWQRFVDFCAVTEDATAVAVTRIVLGMTILLHLLMMVRTGESTTVMVHHTFGGLQEGAKTAWASPAMVTLLVVATSVCGALMALGLFTRSAIVLAWAGMRLVSQVSIGAHGGTDALLIDLLVLLAFSGCGNTLSLDAWRRRRTGHGVTDMPALRVVRLMIVVQLVLLYTLGGLQKVSYGWVPGGDASALWFALHQLQWTRLDSMPPAWAWPFTQLATTSSWLFEVLAPLLLVSIWCELKQASSRLGRFLARVELRGVYLLYGVLMHLGIEVLMEVGPYMYVTCSMYACVLGPEVCRRLLRRQSPSPSENS
jgi:hypothetical protein